MKLPYLEGLLPFIVDPSHKYLERFHVQVFRFEIPSSDSHDLAELPYLEGLLPYLVGPHAVETYIASVSTAGQLQNLESQAERVIQDKVALFGKSHST